MALSGPLSGALSSRLTDLTSGAGGGVYVPPGYLLKIDDDRIPFMDDDGVYMVMEA